MCCAFAFQKISKTFGPISAIQRMTELFLATTQMEILSRLCQNARLKQQFTPASGGHQTCNHEKGLNVCAFQSAAVINHSNCTAGRMYTNGKMGNQTSASGTSALTVPIKNKCWTLTTLTVIRVCFTSKKKKKS